MSITKLHLPEAERDFLFAISVFLANYPELGKPHKSGSCMVGECDAARAWQVSLFPRLVTTNGIWPIANHQRVCKVVFESLRHLYEFLVLHFSGKGGEPRSDNIRCGSDLMDQHQHKLYAYNVVYKIRALMQSWSRQ